MQRFIDYLKENEFAFDLYMQDDEIAYFSKNFQGEKWVFSLTAPHKGNDMMWLFRAEKKKNFSKWGDVYFEEKYYSYGHFILYAIKEWENCVENYLESE